MENECDDTYLKICMLADTKILHLLKHDDDQILQLYLTEIACNKHISLFGISTERISLPFGSIATQSQICSEPHFTIV
jgi:hypothetical protein